MTSNVVGGQALMSQIIVRQYTNPVVTLLFMNSEPGVHVNPPYSDYTPNVTSIMFARNAPLSYRRSTLGGCYKFSVCMS